MIQMNDIKKATSLKDLGKLTGGNGPETKYIRGRIKTYRKDKRFGFITPVDGKKDVFFHLSVVKEGEPREGIEVRFRIGKGKDGRTAATEVIILKNGVQKAEKPNSDFQLNLPEDTANLLGDQVTICENYAIFSNHLIQWKLKRGESTHEIPNDFLLTLQKFKFSGKLYNQLYSRHKRLVGAIPDTYSTCSFSAKVDWRIVIGLGDENVHEISMTLHHIYGIPYISGSALKGIARNAAVEELIGENEEPDVMDALISLPDISKTPLNKKREVVLKASKIKRADGTSVQPLPETINKLVDGKWNSFESARKVFGNQTKAGIIMFLDALPVSPPNVKADIMNPHYPDYYGKGEPPSDWQNPIPIPFLTVENTTFGFCLAVEKKEKDLLHIAEEWLQKGLCDQGIGAKTAVGYGYFQIN